MIVNTVFYQDLGIANIEITLFGLDKPDRKFDTNIFYKVKKKGGDI